MEKEEILKITNELYRLTLFFPKKEPLRYKMREIGTEILALFLKSENPQEQNQLLSKLEILDAFFDVARAQSWVKPADLLSLQLQYQKLKSQIKTSFPLPFNFSLAPQSFFQKAEKKIFPTEKIEKTEKTDFQTNPTAEARQNKILQILKEKGKAQVWEIKQTFPEVSKRTLRRDFVSLLKRGLVERIGERNITFYRLKTKEA